MPVGEAGTEWEGDVFAHGLEGLEDEGVACRGRLDAMGEGDVNNVDEEGWGKESASVIVIVGLREEVWAAGEGIRPAKSFPGTRIIFRLKSARSISQQAC